MLPYLTVKMSYAFLGMGPPNPSCSLSRLCELVDVLPWDMDEIKGRCRNCIATRIQLRFCEEIPVQAYVDNLSTWFPMPSPASMARFPMTSWRMHRPAPPPVQSLSHGTRRTPQGADILRKTRTSSGCSHPSWCRLRP